MGFIMSKILGKTIERADVPVTHVHSDMVLDLLLSELNKGNTSAARQLNADYFRIALAELEIVKAKIYSVHLCNGRRIQNKEMENE